MLILNHTPLHLHWKLKKNLTEFRSLPRNRWIRRHLSRRDYHCPVLLYCPRSPSSSRWKQIFLLLNLHTHTHALSSPHTHTHLHALTHAPTPNGCTQWSNSKKRNFCPYVVENGKRLKLRRVNGFLQFPPWQEFWRRTVYTRFSRYKLLLFQICVARMQYDFDHK